MRVQATFYKHQEWDWTGVVPDDLKDEGEIRFWIDSHVRETDYELAGEYLEDGPIQIITDPRWIKTREMHIALLSWKTGDYIVFVEDADELLQGPLTSELDIIRAKGATFVIQENV
jgi:hypothetical protein